MILGQCQVINTCDQYSYWNGNQCVCQSGYVLNPITQKCTQQTYSPNCPSFSTFNGVFCCCNEGYYPIK